ncbi:MAG: TolC family protein [Pseudomonadota bacterium]|nr:TolC family protein [Pseudomonadota bacterium]MDP1905234.1 TolC family protein [Pseudomonadota bacterium]MDP2352796.1 TolC family protein [Pseudomonadota bacterium]
MTGLCLLAASTWVTSTWAAPTTFGQALQAALTTHPLMQGKRSAQAAAQAEREGAEWQRYPTPSIEANTATGGSNASLLRIDQPLWTGGRITSSIDAAGSRFDAAGMAIDEARQELVLRVIAAGSEALRQQARQRHAQANVGEHEKLLAMIRRRVAQEVSPLADQRLAESRLYSAVNELSAATQALQNALAQLGQLTGQTVMEFDPWGYTEATRPDGLPGDLVQMIDRALAHSPTLRRLNFEAQAANADIDSKRSAYMPQLSLRLESSHGDTSDNRALLVLLAQPGAGLSAKSGVDAAFHRREATRQAVETARRDARERVSLDWNEWTAARSRLDNAEQVRSTSVEVSESYARQYTAGRKTWLDVLNAVRETTLAELALVDARSQMQAAVLRLKALTGGLGLDAK